MPFVNIFYLGMDFYIRVRAVVTPYFVKYKAPETKEQPAQITDSPKVESTETKASSVIAAVIAVDNSGAPTASDCQTALQNTTAAQERIWALMNEVASAEIFYEGLIPVVSMLIFIAFCLLMRFAQLVHR
jgi:enamine deaminase RidA (YjgF/YER057c/UK114 family)